MDHGPTDAPPASPVSSEYAESILLHYWRILRKRAIIVGMFTGLLMVTVAVATALSTPIYKATAVIEISPKTDNVVELDQVSDLVTATSTVDLRNYYATQYKVMESRTVIERALSDLRDAGVQDFDEADDEVKFFRERLAIKPVVETHLVRVSFEYPDPAKAALFADALADAYIDNNLERASASTQRALAWLEDQRKALKDEKYRADVKTYEFRNENDLVGISDAYNGSVQRLKKLQDAWSDAATERTRLEARFSGLQRLQAPADWAPLAQTLATRDVVLRDLLSRYDQLEQERSRLAATLLDQAPPMVEVRTQLDAVEAQIRQQVNEVVAGEKATLDLARKQEQALLSDLEGVQTEVDQLDRQLIDLRLLEAESERSSEFFGDIDRRMAEVRLSNLLRNNNVRFVDRAVADDEPVRPVLTVNLAMALALGLFGGALLAFALEYLDTTVKSREDIEDFVGIAMLGVVPRIDPLDLKALSREVDRNIFVHARPRSTVAECLRSIRTNVLFRIPQKPVRTLLVTSASPMEGKSFTSSNLASIIAMSGQRVLLVDADLRRPSIHKNFSLPNEVGLSAVLLGESTFEDVLQQAHVPGLDVVVAGPPAETPGETLTEEAVAAFLETVSGYDFIIIDSPPVNVVADPLVMSNLVDGVLLVVEGNQTSKRLVRMAGSRLAEVQAPVLGAIVNKLDVRAAGYGYNYYENYGYYYAEGEEALRQRTG